MTDIVDPYLAFEGYASLANHDGHPIKAVQAAYNKAAKGVIESGREPVMIRVIVHVAQAAINFDSDAPLAGGVCDMSAGCESCQ